MNLIIVDGLQEQNKIEIKDIQKEKNDCRDREVESVWLVN